MKQFFLFILLLLSTDLALAEVVCQIDESKTGTIQVLNLGDFSCDGHCKTSETTICSSLTAENFLKAYTIGAKRIGFNLEDVADEYEESSLSKEQVAALQANGINIKDTEASKDGAVTLYVDNYIDIYLQIVKLGQKDFQYKRAKSYIRIGGYGFFE
jgi:hypothetical protein